MRELLYGRHPEILKFLSALGVPNLDRIRSFELTGAVDEVVQMKIEYMVDANDLDCDIICANFGVACLDEPSLSPDKWPETLING